MAASYRVADGEERASGAGGGYGGSWHGSTRAAGASARFGGDSRGTSVQPQHRMLAEAQATSFSDSMRAMLTGEAPPSRTADSPPPAGHGPAAVQALPGSPQVSPRGAGGGEDYDGGDVAGRDGADMRGMWDNGGDGRVWDAPAPAPGTSASAGGHGSHHGGERTHGHHRDHGHHHHGHHGHHGHRDEDGEHKNSHHHQHGHHGSEQVRDSEHKSDSGKRGKRKRRRTSNSRTTMCAVCVERPALHFNLPCGHKCLCETCYAEEQQYGQMYCPMCMEVVEDFLPEGDPRIQEYFMKNEDWQELRDNSTFQQVLDEDWEQHLDPESGEMFYVNNKTAVTQWEYPLDDGGDRRGFVADHYNYEGLGPNWESTAWVPPKEKLARGYRSNEVFAGGNAPLCKASTDDLAALGVGTTLYFRFLKYLALVFMAMTVIALPVMEVYRQGKRMPDRVPDPLGVSVLSLGNAGDPAQDPFVQDNTSLSVFSTSNVTTTDVWGWKLTSVGASFLVSLCDFIYTWLFIAFLFWLRARIRTVEEHNKKHVRASDFSVYVRGGLPKDATAQEIRTHFSGLFSLVEAERQASQRRLDPKPSAASITPLNSPNRVVTKASSKTRPVALGKLGKSKSVMARDLEADPSRMFVDRHHLVVYTQPGDLNTQSSFRGAPWQGRAVRQTLLKPVEDVSHNNDDSYYGSWVADVQVIHPNGKNIRTFLAVDHLTERLRVARARAKMYMPNTPHEDGPNPERAKHAMAEVSRLEFEMASIRTKMEARAEKVEDVCIGAFVTFNHEESFLRCAQEYHGSKNLLRRLFQKRHLRFRGKNRLRVDPAPNPSDVLWENLETTACQGCMRRQFTAFVTFLLILFSFVVILLAQSTQQKFLKQVPDLGMCEQELPTIFLGSHTDFETAFHAAVAAGTGPIRLERPSTFDRPARDASCGSGKYYATYPSLPGAAFDVAACESSVSVTARAADIAAGGPNIGIPSSFCPDPRRGTQCPCLDPGDKGQCFSLECFKPELATDANPCREFSAATVVGCYCLAQLEFSIDAKGTLSGGQDFLDTEDDVCGEWASNFFLAQGFTALAAGVVAVVNAVLKVVLARLVAMERHHSVTRESGAIAIKIFLSQFINTGLVVLAVHGRLPNNIQFPLESLGMFGGKYDDFHVEWYGSVGAMLVLAMIANIFTPHFEHLFGWCLQSIRRRRALKQGAFLTQTSMNKAFVGPVFDLSERYAQVLMVVFVCFLYSGGIPLLLPLCSISLWVHYAVDKVLIMRYHQKPPAYGSYLNHLVVWLLPWSLVGHVAASVWMYGNNAILESTVINPAIIDGWTPGSAKDADELYDEWFKDAVAADGIGAGARVVRVNVFPHFITLCLLLAALIVWRLLAPYVRPVWFRLRHGRWRTSFALERKLVSPYTADFAKLLSDDGNPGGSNAPGTPKSPTTPEAVAHAIKYASTPHNQRGEEANGAEQRRSSMEAIKKKTALSTKYLTKLEMSQGWRVQQRGTVLVLQKQWMDSRRVHGGLWHEYGQLKRTWEVMADAGVPSYDIIANPKYREAFRAQIEEAMAEDDSDSDGSSSSSSSDDSGGDDDDDDARSEARTVDLEAGAGTSEAPPPPPTQGQAQQAPPAGYHAGDDNVHGRAVPTGSRHGMHAAASRSQWTQHD